MGGPWRLQKVQYPARANLYSVVSKHDVRLGLSVCNYIYVFKFVALEGTHCASDGHTHERPQAGECTPKI